MRPEALEEIGGCELVERRVVRGLGFSEREVHALRAAGPQQLLLVDDRTEQRRKGIGEELYAVDLKLLRHVEERDLRVLQGRGASPRRRLADRFRSCRVGSFRDRAVRRASRAASC